MTRYPADLDTFVNPSDVTPMTDHAAQHVNANDAILALETRIGVTGSQDAASIERRLALLEARPAGEAFPIGSIYTNVTGINPATELGYGTWVAFGAGRVLVGQDAGQAEFDTLLETGGAKTHLLTINEMPSHTHVQDAHTHGQSIRNSGTAGTAGTQGASTANNATAGTTAAATAVNQNTGGGLAHNNLQPYIVCSFWRRTA